MTLAIKSMLWRSIPTLNGPLPTPTSSDYEMVPVYVTVSDYPTDADLIDKLAILYFLIELSTDDDLNVSWLISRLRVQLNLTDVSDIRHTLKVVISQRGAHSYRIDFWFPLTDDEYHNYISYRDSES